MHDNTSPGNAYMQLGLGVDKLREPSCKTWAFGSREDQYFTERGKGHLMYSKILKLTMHAQFPHQLQTVLME